MTYTTIDAVVTESGPAEVVHYRTVNSRFPMIVERGIGHLYDGVMFRRLEVKRRIDWSYFAAPLARLWRWLGGKQ